MNATITDSRLEEMMQDEAGCEANHPAGVACTIKVTHHYRAKCNGTSKLVCSATAAHVARSVAGRYYEHNLCLNLCADCWSVVPV